LVNPADALPTSGARIADRCTAVDAEKVMAAAAHAARQLLGPELFSMPGTIFNQIIRAYHFSKRF
jgi:hypothetical protein